MFITIRESFEEIEYEYTTARNDKTSNNFALVEKLGKAYDKALTLYNASLNVQFDLDEIKEGGSVKFEVELNEADRTEIRTMVNLMKNNTGQIDRIMKSKYDEYIELNHQLIKEPDNQELAKSAAYAEQTYTAWKVDYSEVKAFEE